MDILANYYPQTTRSFPGRRWIDRPLLPMSKPITSRYLDLIWIGPWIMLLIITTMVNSHNKKMYWRKSDSPYHINVDFTEFMTMNRFVNDTLLHVFVVLKGDLANADALY
ncbi:hypothetical protein BC941DRAFT_475480 [Chlamydoabsidia padenii]|nr:hypothetical protein BC941DRAFT_475480 [Chlamydoabsidia padenii]